MDPSEAAAAAERSVTNDASPSAVTQASTEPITTEANMGVHQHITSTSRIQIEMSPLYNYVMDLSEEEWESFAAAMSNTVTKAQFLTVCYNVTKLVMASAVNIIIPSLVRRFREDPVDELLMGSEDSRGSINVTGICPENPSIIKGVLTKVTPETGSRSSVRSCDEPLMSSCSLSGKRSSTSLQTTSLPHGVTKEHILQSVQRSLTNLNEAGSAPDSDEWIEAIITEVTHVVDSTFLRRRPNSASSACPHQRTRTSEKMKNLYLKLRIYLAQQRKTSKSQASSLLGENENMLDSITAEAMTTVMHQIETCFHKNEKNHSAKKIIMTMKAAIQILACQSISSRDIPALGSDDLGELKVCEEEKLGQNPGQSSTQALERLSSEQFCTKAKKAISDILIEKVKVVYSTSQPRLSSVSFPGSKITMEENERSSSGSSQPIYSVSSGIVETFVEELTSILEFTECARQLNTNEETSATICSETSVVPKSQVLEAAKGLYDRVQAKIKQFLKNPVVLWRKGMSTTDIDEMEAEALEPMDATSALCSQHSSMKPTITSSEQLLRPTRPLLRKTLSDGTHSIALGELHLTQTQLDKCTKDALRGVLNSFLSQGSQKPCSSSTSSADTFVAHVIFQLDELIPASSSMTSVSSSDHSSKYSLKNLTRTSDLRSTKSSSLECVQKLKSEAFQTNSLMAVSEALLKTLRSHNSSDILNQHLPERVQVSSVFFFPVEKEASDTELDIDVDSAASAMVSQFVTDLQGCVEALHSNNMETDKPHKGNFYTTASKLYTNLLNKMEDFFAQVCLKGVSHTKQLVQEPIAEKSISECDHPHLEEQNLHSEVDPSGITKEVLSKVFTLYKDEMDENSKCDLTPAVSSHDKNLLLHLEAYFATSESPIQGLGVEDHSNETVPSPTKLFEKLSEEKFQTEAAEVIGDVLLLAVRCLTDFLDTDKVDPQISPVEAQSVASDLVTEVTDVVQKLLEATASTAPPTSPCSDMEECIARDMQSSQILQTTEGAAEIIWSTTCKTFQSLRRKIKIFFAKYHLAHSKAEDNEKEGIDKVLVFVHEQLAQTMNLDCSEDLQMIRSIVSSLIDNIGQNDAKFMKEPQRQNPNLSIPSKSKLSKLNLPGSVLSLYETPTEAPPVQHIYIDMDDGAENDPSPVSRESVAMMVRTISTALDVQNEDCTLSPTQDLTSVRERLERMLRSEKLSPLSHDLTNQIHQLYFKSQKGMAATQSVSDALLLNVEQRGEFHKKHIVRQITQVYAEETVKHFFLPCFNIPSDWTMEVGGLLQQASSSASCPSFLYSMSKEVPKGASKSPLQILQSTLLVLTKVMVRDVMNMVDLTLQSPGDLEDQTDLQPLPDSMRLFSRPSSGDPTQISLSEDIVTDSSDPLLTPVDSTSDEYTSLVTMLVIRLCSKLNDQESLTDDMLDISKSLIERIITEIDAALGVPKTKTCPHGVRLRKVFRAIYHDLLHEFGSKEILLKALMSEDPWFEKTLIACLTREVIHTPVTPKPKEEMTKKRTPGFLQKISKIKAIVAISLKRSSKSSNNKKQSTNGDQNLDPASAQVDPTVQCENCLPCVAPVASRNKALERKLHNNFFSRIVSRFSKIIPKNMPTST